MSVSCASDSGLLGFTRQATLACGRSSRSSSSRFAVSAPERMVTPVTLPPGRLRLATRPSLIGSPPTMKTIGMVEVEAFAACVGGTPPTARRYLLAHQLGCQRRQPVDVILGPTVLDRHISMLEKACLVQALPKCGNELLAFIERYATQN